MIPGEGEEIARPRMAGLWGPSRRALLETLEWERVVRPLDADVQLAEVLR